MKKCITVLIALFSFTHYAKAGPEHFVEGYVLLNNGDTLKGLIDDQEWKTNPELIYFKSSPESPATSYTPLTIRSFRMLKGDWYFSFAGNVESSLLATSSLKSDPAPSPVKDTVFLRSLVIGKASLYYLFGENGREHYFIQKDNDSITELIYKKYLVNDGNGTHIKQVEIYKSQLAKLLSDCEEVAVAMMDVPVTYSKNSLVNTIQHYNKCQGAPETFVEKKEKWKFEISLAGGINSSKLLFSSDDDFWNQVNFEKSLGYAVGAGLNIVIPRDRGRWSIYNELFLRNYKAEGKTPENVLTDTTDRLTADFVYLKLATMIRFQVPHGKIKPYVNAGMTNGYALKAENTRYHSNGHAESLLDYTRRYEQGFIMGLGVRVFGFTLEGRYETSNGIDQSLGIGTRFHTLYALAGYTF